MLNILPIEEKKKILTEYRLRLGVVAVFAVALLVAASSVLLAPSYVLTVSKYNMVSDALAKLTAAQSGVDKEKEINTATQDVNKKVAVFLADKKVEYPAPGEVVTKITSLKGPAVRIQNILYDAAGEKLRVVVTGQANDRDSLAQFVETLKKDPSFTKVDLPIGSYVKSVNIDFSLALEEAPGGTPKK